MKKTLVIKYLMLAMIFSLPLFALAQAPDPGDDPDVPIDGGLSLLVAAGVGYVAKKGYDKRKKTAQFPGIEK